MDEKTNRNLSWFSKLNVTSNVLQTERFFFIYFEGSGHGKEFFEARPSMEHKKGLKKIEK